MKDIYRETGEDALCGVQAKSLPPPGREEMLARVYLRATNKEDHMTIFGRLFAGRPLAAKLGIAATLLLLLVAAAILLPRPGYSPALAATEGVVLNYDMSAYGEQDHAGLQAKFQELERSFAKELPEGAQLRTNVSVEVRREKRVVKQGEVEQGSPQETETHKATLRVLLSGADEATLDKLRRAIATAVPGIPEPRIEDATWFREGGGSLDGGINITLDLNDKEHVFNFPKGTGAEQIKSEIKAWVDQNHPGMDFNVDVNVSGDGQEKQQIEVRIERKGDEGK
jgi:hypothetical protein